VEPLHAIIVFVVSVIAMLCFAAATQGYFFAPNKLWEVPILLLIAFTLFRPGYWLDQVQAPFDVYEGPAVVEQAGALPEGSEMRVIISGPDFDTGDTVETTLVPVLPAQAEGAVRLGEVGLPAMVDGDVVRLDEPPFGTTFFEKLSRQYDFYGDEPVRIVRAEVAAERMPKEVFFIPALVLLLLLIMVQRRRATQPAF
jgi:hypothetical protein